MARKIIQVTIDDPGRDLGKTFIVHEMSPRQAQFWGMSMLAAMGRSGVTLPDAVSRSGMAGIAYFGIAAVLGAAGSQEAMGLLDELMDSCVGFIPDRSKPTIFLGAPALCLPAGRLINGTIPKGPLTGDEIEEISTRFRLQKEALLLHMGFLPPAVRSSLETFWRSVGSSLSNIPTSIGSSEQ